MTDYLSNMDLQKGVLNWIGHCKMRYRRYELLEPFELRVGDVKVFEDVYDGIKRLLRKTSTPTGFDGFYVSLTQTI
jgi:hypothetical protein